MVCPFHYDVKTDGDEIRVGPCSRGSDTDGAVAAKPQPSPHLPRDLNRSKPFPLSPSLLAVPLQPPPLGQDPCITLSVSHRSPSVLFPSRDRSPTRYPPCVVVTVRACPPLRPAVGARGGPVTIDGGRVRSSGRREGLNPT